MPRRIKIERPVGTYQNPAKSSSPGGTRSTGNRASSSPGGSAVRPTNSPAKTAGPPREHARKRNRQHLTTELFDVNLHTHTHTHTHTRACARRTHMNAGVVFLGSLFELWTVWSKHSVYIKVYGFNH